MTGAARVLSADDSAGMGGGEARGVGVALAGMGGGRTGIAGRAIPAGVGAAPSPLVSPRRWPSPELEPGTPELEPRSGVATAAK